MCYFPTNQKSMFEIQCILDSQWFVSLCAFARTKIAFCYTAQPSFCCHKMVWADSPPFSVFYWPYHALSHLPPHVEGCGPCSQRGRPDSGNLLLRSLAPDRHLLFSSSGPPDICRGNRLRVYCWCTYARKFVCVWVCTFVCADVSVHVRMPACMHVPPYLYILCEHTELSKTGRSLTPFLHFSRSTLHKYCVHVWLFVCVRERTPTTIETGTEARMSYN